MSLRVELECALLANCSRAINLNYLEGLLKQLLDLSQVLVLVSRSMKGCISNLFLSDADATGPKRTTMGEPLLGQ